jgi:hypothetical protein
LGRPVIVAEEDLPDRLMRPFSLSMAMTPCTTGNEDRVAIEVHGFSPAVGVANRSIS